MRTFFVLPSLVLHVGTFDRLIFRTVPTLTPTTMDQNPHVLKLKAAQEAAQEAHVKALQAQKKALQDEMQSQHDLMKKRMQAAKVDAKKALQEQKQALQDQMESQHGALKKHISSEVGRHAYVHAHACHMHDACLRWINCEPGMCGRRVGWGSSRSR